MIKLGICLKRLDYFSANGYSLVRKGDPSKYIFYIYYLEKYYKNELPLVEIENVNYRDMSMDTDLRNQFVTDGLDAVILFDPGNLFEITIISICKEAGIRSIYYQHGIVSSDSSLIGKINKEYFRNSILKYIFFLRLVIKFLRGTNNLKKNISVFSVRMFSLIRLDRNPLLRRLGIKELKFDYAYVYSVEDKRILANQLKIDENRIFTMGFPFMEEDPSFYPIPTRRKKILYISSGLYDAGLIDSQNQFKIYKAVIDLCISDNLDITIKVHPKENESIFMQLIPQRNNIRVVKNVNLSSLVRTSDIVMGDYSTALFYAVKHYKPIIILEYHFFRSFPFNYTDYGIGYKVSLENLFSFFKSFNPVPVADRKVYDKFLQNYLGYNGKEANEIFYDKLKEIIPSLANYKEFK